MEFAEGLLKTVYVAAVPGEAFGSAKHIRISYAASVQELDRGLTRIDQYVRQLDA